MDLKDIGCVDMEWIYLVQDREQVVGCCGHGNEHTGSVVLASEEWLCSMELATGSLYESYL